MERCPKHLLEFTIVPAGTSKKTGKAYPAFWKCNARNVNGEFCSEKPRAQAINTTVGKFETTLLENELKEKEAKKEKQIIRSVALKAAVDSLEKNASTSDVLQTAQAFENWLMR